MGSCPSSRGVNAVAAMWAGDTASSDTCCGVKTRHRLKQVHKGCCERPHGERCSIKHGGTEALAGVITHPPPSPAASSYVRALDHTRANRIRIIIIVTAA